MRGLRQRSFGYAFRTRVAKVHRIKGIAHNVMQDIAGLSNDFKLVVQRLEASCFRWFEMGGDAAARLLALYCDSVCASVFPDVKYNRLFLAVNERNDKIIVN